MSLILGISAPTLAQAASADCVPLKALQPPQANTTAPHKPFFIDTSGLSGSGAMPIHDPHDPLYPEAIDLPDNALPPVDKTGNYILGTSHTLPAQWQNIQLPEGRIISFTLASSPTSGYNPGTVRDDPVPCTTSTGEAGMVHVSTSVPGDPSNLTVPGAHPAPWTRTVDIYIPPNTPTDRPLPFLIFGDGSNNGLYPGRDLFAMVDGLLKEKRIPPMIVIGVGAGGGDAQGSERGREYDTMSGAYADWVEAHVLPLVEKKASLTLSRNPEERATMGFSSSGAAAFAMAWFRPNLYHRVLAYSPSLVNQQWPHDPALPGGGWQLHSPWAGTPEAVPPHPGAALIPAAPLAPLHIWYEVGDQDLFYPVPSMPDGMHDWVLAGENMARVLADKGYDYQFVFARNARHVDGPTIEQTLPEALEWLWRPHMPPTTP
ncbi:alpha/beta hydrolase [Bombella apis]|uniref:Esterase family protein n=1 Tax=Bombella apis TaxID=1785988 RepID=A0ABR9MRF7_9PROT|nr:alpha/beta hydrolase-fold protein [Bombella apis]MBE1724452.1 esterase family protein [Bombella apis]MBR9729755.1 esterase family protein [Bombella apis]